MKTITKLSITGFATVLLAAGAFANESEWVAIDNHHGSVAYIFRPSRNETTVAVFAHGKAAGRTEVKAGGNERRINQVTTAHGAVSYFAPAE